MNGASESLGTIRKYLTFKSSETQKERPNKSRLEKALKEIMAENYPNLIRYINLHIQEAEQNTNKINPKRSLPTHIIIKLLETKDKGKQS